MLRVFVRFSGVLGLAALVLVLAGSVLGAPVVRSGVIQPMNAGLPQAAPGALDFTIVMSQVVGPGGLNKPVEISNAGDGSGRLFVLEQDGYIRVIKNGTLLSTPYLTITDKVWSDGEQGLLGLEFDPNFEANGTFYVNYSTNAPGFEQDTVVARYQVSNPAADTANVINVTHIITIDQPDGEPNHKGGDLHFGPDGYLYIGMGDGGGGGDQHGAIGNGQNPAALLGKMLRLNVRGVPTYTIPPSNPFTQTAGYRPEIWALGLRNPWRFSFDRATGDLYIGDVGQNCWEEISYQPASSHGGENYGWRIMEGFHPFNVSNFDDCLQPPITPPTITLPITAYGHDSGNSAVTGGYVYRGQQYPWMQGVYFYSDSGSGRIWAIQQVSPGVWSSAEKLDTPYGITAFGEDENGELYVTDYSQGRIYKITSPSQIDFSTSSKSASTSQASTGSTVTYTIVVRNTGEPFSNVVRVTDTLPTGLSYVAGSLAATSGTPDASSAPTLKWNGVMSPTSIVTITFRALVTAGGNQIVTNTATINPALLPPFTRSAAVTVSGPNLTSTAKLVSPGTARSGEVATYTIVLRNTGAIFPTTVRVTDTVPAGLNYLPGSLTATSGTPDASSAPTLKWNGVMSTTPVITLTYAVTVATASSASIVNSAAINPGYGVPFTRTAVVLVNPREVFLPVILRGN